MAEKTEPKEESEAAPPSEDKSTSPAHALGKLFDKPKMEFVSERWTALLLKNSVMVAVGW